MDRCKARRQPRSRAWITARCRVWTTARCPAWITAPCPAWTKPRPKARRWVRCLQRRQHGAALRRLSHPSAHDGQRRHQHLLFDKLGVAYDRNEQTSLQWDGQFWIGRDLNKLWIKSEGDRLNGSTDAKIEAFWSHTISPFWDLQLGARRDFGTGPKRNWAAFGVQGVTPYGIETEITGYVGGSGRTALALKAEYDLLLTQRLILTPEIEASLYGKNDEARGVGSGLSDASFSLRLRYEVTREFAPYVACRSDASSARPQATPAKPEKAVPNARSWPACASGSKHRRAAIRGAGQNFFNCYARIRASCAETRPFPLEHYRNVNRQQSGGQTRLPIVSPLSTQRRGGNA